MEATERGHADIASHRSAPRHWAYFALLLVLGPLIVATVVLTTGEANLMKSVSGVGDAAPDGNADLNTLKAVVDKANVPLNWALWTIVPLGMVAGGGMLAVGSRRGMQVMATSAGAGVAVLLGKGLIA